MLLKSSLTLVASLVGTASILQAQEPSEIPPPDVPVDAVPLPADPAAAPSPTTDTVVPSTNVTVNLITRLVQKGILTAEEAQVLIQQAELDAAKAQAAQAAIPQPLDPLTGAPAGQETRVTYIPENVKNDMRDQIRQELMAAAREEDWGTSEIPDWTRKIRLFGDFRGRYEFINFGDQNDPGALFTNFNAINNGSPYDVTNALYNFPALYNVDQDRERARIRVRAGAEIMLGDGFDAGFRIATGESNSPTSPTRPSAETAGISPNTPSGSTAPSFPTTPARASATARNSPSSSAASTTPFFSTEIQWDDDIGFDGLAARGRVNLTDNVSTFFSGGAFPVYNTDFNISSNQPEKFESTDKWLYGAQIGIDWKINEDWKAKVGVSYYDFKTSKANSPHPTSRSAPRTPATPTPPALFSPSAATPTCRCATSPRPPPTASAPPTSSNTTASPPSSATSPSPAASTTTTTRKSNSPSSGKSPKTSATTKATSPRAPSATAARPHRRHHRRLRRRRPRMEPRLPGRKAGAQPKRRLARHTRLPLRRVRCHRRRLHRLRLRRRGTNVRGFSLGAQYALNPSVRIGAKWMSADEIDGPPLSTDTIQFDLNARF